MNQALKRAGMWLIVLVAAIALPATAAVGYPIGVEPVASVSDLTPLPGQTITISAANFCPGQTASFFVDDVFVGSATVAADTTVSLVITAPTTPGPHTIRVQAPNCDNPSGPSRAVHAAAAAVPAGQSVPLDVVTFTIVVQDGDLPPTGASSSFPLTGSMIVFGVGAGLALIAIRRRRSAAA
jgi:hypothetical protein